MSPQRLSFEKEIYEMEDALARMEAGGNAEEVRRIRRELVNLKKKVYGNLKPWQTVEVSRHAERPQTLVICVVIGEGGSGGALGIGIGARVSMLEHAYYSVISPEGCAGILWKVATDETKPLAADALKLTAKDLARLGVIDDIIPEPLGGAHRDQREMGNTLKTYLLRYLRELRGMSGEDLLEQRYQKFRR